MLKNQRVLRRKWNNWIAKNYISFQVEKEELEKILNDSSGDEELKKMAELELIELQNRHEANEKIKIIFIA